MIFIQEDAVSDVVCKWRSSDLAWMWKNAEPPPSYAHISCRGAFFKQSQSVLFVPLYEGSYQSKAIWHDGHTNNVVSKSPATHKSL